MHNEANDAKIVKSLCNGEAAKVNKQNNHQILGIILLISMNEKRYCRLLADLCNNYIKDNNYLNTFTKASSLLLNHRKERVEAKDAGS